VAGERGAPVLVGRIRRFKDASRDESVFPSTTREGIARPVSAPQLTNWEHGTRDFALAR
jgi:hypothetical protein